MTLDKDLVALNDAYNGGKKDGLQEGLHLVGAITPVDAYDSGRRAGLYLGVTATVFAGSTFVQALDVIQKGYFDYSPKNIILYGACAISSLAVAFCVRKMNGPKITKYRELTKMINDEERRIQEWDKKHHLLDR